MTALFRNLSKGLSENLLKAVDVVLPPRCIVSGEIVEKQGVMSPYAWSDLSFIGQPQCVCCGVPFDYALDEGSCCSQCLENKPYFSKARAALKYNEASKKIILGFKHGDKTHAVKTFIPWMKKAGESFLEKADFMLPVPLHPTRLRQRRYNQSVLMMKELSKSTGVYCIPDGIIRVRATPSQGHKTFEERKKNVKKAFMVNAKYTQTLREKRVILVDDVFTTGATVNECARVLLSGGVAEVYVLTLARVVKEELL